MTRLGADATLLEVAVVVSEALGFTDAGDGRHFEHRPSGWLIECPPGNGSDCEPGDSMPRRCCFLGRSGAASLPHVQKARKTRAAEK